MTSPLLEVAQPGGATHTRDDNGLYLVEPEPQKYYYQVTFSISDKYSYRLTISYRSSSGTARELSSTNTLAEILSATTGGSLHNICSGRANGTFNTESLNGSTSLSGTEVVMFYTINDGQTLKFRSADSAFYFNSLTVSESNVEYKNVSKITF